MSDVLDAALAYRARGWSVFPISPRTKRPLVKWAQYQTKLPSIAQVRKWWKEFLNANVAIVTGEYSNLIVLDVDTRKGADAKRIYQQYPTPFVSRTGGGGYHFFYTYPRGQDVRNSVGTDGIDVRGNGGYVVAPPSLHASGKYYRWVKGDDDATPGSPPADLLYRRSSRVRTEAGWFDRVIQGVDKGERNDACSRLAGYYLNKMPVDHVIQTLQTWNKLNNPPLPTRQITQTVESINRTHEKKQSIIVAPKLIDTSDTKPEVHSYLELTPWNQYLAKFGGLSTDWIINGWLPDKTIAMMVAAPGSYKTWILLDLIVSIASGKPFLGQLPIEKTGPVIVFQQEDWGGILAERLATIVAVRWGLKMLDNLDDQKKFRYVVPPNLPIYFHEHRKLSFADKEAMDCLYELCGDLRPRLVALDPLYSAATTEGYMAEAARQALRLKDFRDEFGTSFQLLHHTRKALDQRILKAMGKISSSTDIVPIDREDSWGSQFLNALVESGWQVRREDKPATLQIKRHFKVSEDAPREIITFHIKTRGLNPQYEVDIRRVDEFEVLQPPGIMALIDAHGPLSIAQLSRLLDQHRTTVHRNVQNLVKAGELSKGTDGRYYAKEEING